MPPADLIAASATKPYEKRIPAPVVWVPTKQNPTIAPITVKSPFAIFAKHYPDRFCDQCPQFPCSEMTDKEIWYANTYPMVESLMGNLALIRKEGMEKFLQLEAERWGCTCGGTICVHTGICSGCGKEYTIRKHKE